MPKYYLPSLFSINNISSIINMDNLSVLPYFLPLSVLIITSFYHDLPFYSNDNAGL